MKKHLRLIALAVCAVSLWTATNAFAKEAIEGEWAAQAKSGTMMTLHFFSDGVWDFDINGDMVKDMWGKYKVKGDTIQLTTIGGKELCKSPKKTGIYTVQLNGPQLTFVEKSDGCAPRADNFSLFWTQQ